MRADGCLHPIPLTRGRVVQGWDRARCYQRWGSGHAVPAWLAVPGELGWNVPQHGLPVSAGPQVQLLVLKSGSNCICVLVNEWWSGTALQGLLCALPEVAGCRSTG